MDWISGIGRDELGQLCVRTQQRDGSSTLSGLGALDADLKLSDVVHRRVVLPLHQLRAGNTRQYLDGLGLQALEAGGQPVYEGHFDGGQVVVSAQQLVLATLGVNAPMREAMLRPWGPSYLMTASCRDGAVSVRPTPNRMLSLDVAVVKTALRMEWVLTYPSAGVAWSSVYRHALDGRFDMTMPSAFAHFSVVGRMVGDKLLATSVKLMKLVPAEDPHPFAAAEAREEFVMNGLLNRRPSHGKAAAPARDERLAVARGERLAGGVAGVGVAGIGAGTGLGQVQELKALTDEQWARVEPLLREFVPSASPGHAGARRAHSLRDQFVVMRLKLGAPYSWSRVPGDKKLVGSASVLLSKLQRAGVWERVVTELCARPSQRLQLADQFPLKEESHLHEVGGRLYQKYACE